MVFASCTRSVDVKKLPSSAISASIPAPAARQKAPKISFKLKSGKTIHWADFEGRVVLVHFWATWCAPCAEELPVLLEFMKGIKDKPVDLLAVSLDADWSEAEQLIPPDWREGGALSSNVKWVMDPEQRVADEFGSFQFPETLLVDRNGRLVTKWVGQQNWKNDYYSKFLAAVY